jgi:hypothetical protein
MIEVLYILSIIPIVSLGFFLKKNCKKQKINQAKIIYKILWFIFLQKMNNSIEYKQDHCILSYTLKGSFYKIKIPYKKDNKVVVILDENYEDVSNEILPFLSPDESFHNSVYTPSFWGKKELTFMDVDGNTKVFSENDEIFIN